MPRVTLSNHVCFPKAKMEYMALHYHSVCAVQGQCTTTFKVLQLFLLSMGYNGMHRQTSSNHVYYQRAMTKSHT